MTIRSTSYRCLFTFLLIFTTFLPAPAQTSQSPDREHLLNGLNVFYWQRPGDSDVLLKLRIHSGAAFDLAGKSGTMALLGDAFFPDPATFEYVNSELGGRLEVSTNYDAIEVTLSGKAAQIERLVELLRNAIITLNLSPENVAKLREARIARLTKVPVSPSQIADRAVALRLFGAFPYGQTTEGTAETVAKVVRADMMFAQERFLHSDNATLAVIGGVEKARLLRALRQLLGPWQKSDRNIAATFRQPGAPDDRILLINQTGMNNAEVRVAVRGLARSDRDAGVTSILAQIARDRWQAAVPELSSASVRSEAHALPGMIIFSAGVPPTAAAKALAGAQDVMKTIAENGVSPAELERTRNLLLAEMGKSVGELDSVASAWLNSETYKTPLTANAANEIGRLSIADIQRVATRLFAGAAQAKVVVADADQVRSSLGAKVEIRDDRQAEKPKADPQTPTKKP
ncbi:MAG: M16 family metallopeptidase [Pyrinomonadaceae bacterium]